MRIIDWDMKFLSIEPIMDFDFTEPVTRIKQIGTSIVEIDTNNYRNHLQPEFLAL